MSARYAGCVVDGQKAKGRPLTARYLTCFRLSGSTTVMFVGGSTQLCYHCHEVTERTSDGDRVACSMCGRADGRPLAGPVDAYLLHGSFYFRSGRDSVRMRHLAARPAVSATHLAGEELAVTVHGRAEFFDVSDPARDLRQAMLDHYLPRQGPAFEAWLGQENPIGARIAAHKMFTFATEG